MSISFAAITSNNKNKLKIRRGFHTRNVFFGFFLLVDLNKVFKSTNIVLNLVRGAKPLKRQSDSHLVGFLLTCRYMKIFWIFFIVQSSVPVTSIIFVLNRYLSATSKLSNDLRTASVYDNHPTQRVFTNRWHHLWQIVLHGPHITSSSSSSVLPQRSIFLIQNGGLKIN